MTTFIEKSLSLRKSLRQFILGWVSPGVLAAEQARHELEVSSQEHWPNVPIHLYELILEKWSSPQEIAKATSPPPPAPASPAPAPPSNNFIVFIDREFDVDWITERSLGPKAAERASFAESISARRCHHLPREQVLEFKRLIGQAIVNAIRGNEKQSSQLASDAAQFLRDRTVERSRVWTLTSSHCLLLAIAILGLFLSVLPLFQNVFSQIPIGLWLTTGGGLLGAYLSVVQKAGSGEWDAASGLPIHVLEVLTKLLAGSLLGGLAFVISQSVYAPLSIKSLTPDSYSLFLFGLTAGLFERLIPRMVSRYADAYENPKQQPKTDE